MGILVSRPVDGRTGTVYYFFGMESKHHLAIQIRDGVSRVALDGRALNRVSGVIIDPGVYGEAPSVRVTMLEPDLDSFVEISDDTAAAIVRVHDDRSMPFLTDEEAAGLRRLREQLRNDWDPHDGAGRLVALDKIIEVLDRREELPF